MIYNHPVGGIGNIFFQLAALWTFAKDNNDELCLINIDEAIVNLINYPSNPIPHAEVFKYVFNRFPNITGNIANKIEHPFTYSPIPYKPEHEYIGYFQCEKYFNHRRNDILNLLKPDESFIPSIQKYSHLFGNISLHVRRGNYVGWSVFDVITKQYYLNALSILPKDMKVLVFSNDLNWCRQQFIGDRFVFIDEIDYISIYLMSKMNHHIIANSSFSWWGAWLSEYKNKVVIGPKTWFGAMFDGSDIIPSNWIKL